MPIGLRIWRLALRPFAWFALCLLAVAAPSGPAPAQSAGIVVAQPGGAAARTLSSAEIEALPALRIRTATPWSEASDFDGPSLTEVLKLAGVLPAGSGGTVVLGAADDYTVRIALADIERLKPILAYRQNGQPLSLRTRGPYWLIFPFDDTPAIQNDLWYYRAIWQITRIALNP
ncbi:hypothetical protein M2352_003804 [Azospirillum fermentarium]|uniref:molybdopterin-dependent oxidoreductase n=1 Tax=Azospirillum fermentarium TaxID=1233114 RepID=UPI00222725AA|nr:molybdopterin-dependent oxidoreductase [Azospirillum fermentarium]MCW2248170.1 hypothetical protein [Azospirillum fermentarium]